MKQSYGFTLIELMIVIAIIGILASIGSAQFSIYQKRSKFADVINETIRYKQSAELAFQIDDLTLDRLDSGDHGIPQMADISGTTKPLSKYVSNVDIQNGIITATGTQAVGNKTYKVTATINGQFLSWAIDPASTCITARLC